MTWIERTAYPRLPRAVSLKELRESFTPGDDEMAWAWTHTQSDRHLGVPVTMDPSRAPGPKKRRSRLVHPLAHVIE